MTIKDKIILVVALGSAAIVIAYGTLSLVSY